MKRNTYMDRAMRSADPRFANILGRLGYERTDAVAAKAKANARAKDEEDETLTALRSEYQDAVGKRAYHGWDADTLREKIAEASEADD